MKNNREDYNRMYANSYNYGSEAPQLIPEERPSRVIRRRRQDEEEVRRQNRELQAQENQRSATRFGFLYTMLIIASVVVMGYNCYNYITTMNKHTENVKTITTLENQVLTTKEQNDEKKLTIDTSIDYDYIYRVATKELGMIYPGEGQIQFYQSGESEYVIQYQDVK